MKIKIVYFLVNFYKNHFEMAIFDTYSNTIRSNYTLSVGPTNETNPSGWCSGSNLVLKSIFIAGDHIQQGDMRRHTELSCATL